MIDAHHHFWLYNDKEFGWIDDKMKLLRRDFVPADLKTEMDTIGVKGVVSVQARQQLEETEALLAWAEQNEFIKGVVGWVDLCSPNAEAQLERYSVNRKFVGVRHVLQDEEDDRFMLREDFMRGISLLSKYNLTYDILIHPRHLAVAVEFVKHFPKQKFVLDHLAKPYIKKGEVQPWQWDIESLAVHPNVYCKISGMVTEADWHAWKNETFHPYMKVVTDSFGYDRIILGSDWPVCLLGGSYAEVMNIPLEYFQKVSEDNRKKIVELNSKEFYRLSD